MLNVCIRFFIYLLKHPLRLDVYRCACIYLCKFALGGYVLRKESTSYYIRSIYVHIIRIQIFVFMLYTNV